MAALPPPPDVAPLAGLPSVTLTSVPEGGAFGDFGTHVAALGAPLELVARRGPNGKIRISQVLGSGGRRRVRRTRLRSSDFGFGIDRFVKFEIRRRSGSVVGTRYASFCPNGGGLRIGELDRSIAQEPTFPSSCGSVFSRAVVWGIDRGWAVAAQPYADFKVPVGHYKLVVTVDPGHRLLDRRRSNNTLRLPLVVEAAPPEPPFEGPVATAQANSLPADAQLPDLQAVPANGMSLLPDGDREYLGFGSTIWNAGPGPVWLEGRRTDRGSTRMRTLQVLPRERGRPVRRLVNSFVFDLRDGHGHWHYNDLANYRLLRPNGSVAAKAEKQGFCFLPTDPIDLTGPGAVLVPPTDFFGAGSCGRAFSTSVRMRLDAGWGDTYGAGLAGQTLETTGLPNGTYFVEVIANATGRMYERNKSNNRSRRRVIIGGSAGARTLRVPPVNGVDTEAGFGEPEPEPPLPGG